MSKESPRSESGMTPLRVILPKVMHELIERARAAGHPPPPFVTESLDRLAQPKLPFDPPR